LSSLGAAIFLKLLIPLGKVTFFQEVIVFPKGKLMFCQPLNNTAWKFVKACLDSKAFLAELGFRSEKKKINLKTLLTR